jgi:hypothetical protein
MSGKNGANFGQHTMDSTLSTIEDIEGEGLLDFREACWMILTSQKPATSILDNFKN